MDITQMLKNLLNTYGVEIINKLGKQYITKENLITLLKSLVVKLKEWSAKTDNKIDDSIITQIESVVNELK